MGPTQLGTHCVPNGERVKECPHIVRFLSLTPLPNSRNRWFAKFLSRYFTHPGQ